MRINKCRVCGNTNLISCLNIGEQYLSSIFPDSLDYKNKLKKQSLELLLCKKDDNNKNCGLLQLANEYDLSEMYKAYPYTSNLNESMVKILKEVVFNAVKFGNLKPKDLILDIGGNDGTLLSFFKDYDYGLLNIDAAQNIKQVFSSENLTVVSDFFSKQKFDTVSSQQARLVFSIAMFYHIANPIEFCKDVESCMKDDGIWAIQMAYLPAMLETNMYDNIVSEHKGYYSIDTLQWVMDKAELEIFDALVNDVYGGSFCVFVKKKKCDNFKTTERLRRLIEKEKQYKIFDLQTYKNFETNIIKSRDSLRKLIFKLKAEHKNIWVYGASTKGNTILQYCEFDTNTITAAADCNPFKFGKYLIGSDIPITDEETMRKANPDYLLVLPYSFIDSFMEKEHELVKKGTQFITPLPYVATHRGII